MDTQKQSEILAKIKQKIQALFDENERLEQQVQDLRIANLALTKALAESLKELTSPRK
jgi:hypothetical protein